MLWSYSSIMVWRSHFYLNASWGENTAGKPKKGAMAAPAIESIWLSIVLAISVWLPLPWNQYDYQLSWQYHQGCQLLTQQPHNLFSKLTINIIILCLSYIGSYNSTAKNSSTFESANRWRCNILVKSSVSVQQGDHYDDLIQHWLIFLLWY